MLWYWTGSKTVSSLSEQVMEEKAERIAQMVDRHIHGSSAVLEAAFPEGLPVDRDIREHLHQFTAKLWMATSLHTRPNDYVYYGNVAGQGIGLKRLEPQLAELRLKTRADENRSYYRVAGINADPIYQSTEKNLFDPRQRPWFKLAQQSSEPVWTPVYIDFNAGDLVLTRAPRAVCEGGV